MVINVETFELTVSPYHPFLIWVFHVISSTRAAASVLSIRATPVQSVPLAPYRRWTKMDGA